MNISKENITGIILAGGKSKRMGTDKGLMDWNGKPMVTYAIEALNRYCSKILISTTNNEYEVFNLDLVPDSIPDLGPIGGLLTCLNISDTQTCICLPCDLPNIKPEVIEFLLKMYDGKSCLVPLSPLPEPLCAIYPLNVLPVIVNLIERKDFSLLSIFKNFPTQYIDKNEFPNQAWKSCFVNINTIDDKKYARNI